MQHEYMRQTVITPLPGFPPEDMETPGGQGWMLHSVQPLPADTYESVQFGPHFQSNGVQMDRETGRTTSISQRYALVIWMREKRLTDQESRF